MNAETKSQRGTAVAQVERYLIRFGPDTVPNIAQFLGLSPQHVRWAVRQVAEKTPARARPAIWRIKP